MTGTKESSVDEDEVKERIRIKRGRRGKSMSRTKESGRREDEDEERMRMKKG